MVAGLQPESASMSSSSPVARCSWPGSDPLYCAYHDEEWGAPEYDSRALWEKLVLDGFQAGLSWITILRKREAFRAAFANFDPEVVARFGEADVERLLADPGIIRSRAKIDMAINGARLYLDMRDKGQDFSAFVWDFVDGQPIQNARTGMGDVPAETPLSQAVSKTLKAKGFKFVGPVIVYAWMQAVGLVNDHVTTCFRHEQVKALAR
jgi:DNA-3-methyladenine glycosylase I